MTTRNRLTLGIAAVGIFVPLAIAAFVFTNIDRGTGGLGGITAMIVGELALMWYLDSRQRRKIVNRKLLTSAFACLFLVVVYFYMTDGPGASIQRLDTLVAAVLLVGFALLNSVISIRLISGMDKSRVT